MDCTKCNIKSCRTLEACKSSKIDAEKVMGEYHKSHNQTIVQAAAALVDNGKAGTLGRLDEVIEFAKSMNYKKVGLAYCYGMEVQAAQVSNYIRLSGLPIAPVSCTVGGFSQASVNETSCIEKVSCNPFSQAEQMNAAGVDFAISMGLCMGHDILFNKHVNADVTTLLVKDRVFNNQPLEVLKQIIKKG
jgi:uncharacterized metal-binding protein